MLIDFLSVLSDADTDLLLAINGWRAEWADYFMYAFSGKLVWIPMYAAILYVIFRNLGWKMALGNPAQRDFRSRRAGRQIEFSLDTVFQ